MAATKTAPADLELGSASIVPTGKSGSAAPAGTLHLVSGWEPLCGGERVRFVFPGREPASEATCPACVQAIQPAAPGVPRQRTSPRARAS